MDWEVGKHGIEVEFTTGQLLDIGAGSGGSGNARVYRGTFLPNVAPEQGWDQVKTLEALVRKAGYHGGFQKVKDHFILIRRYQSLKFGIDYTEYIKKH